jgi:hypothetical protein
MFAIMAGGGLERRFLFLDGSAGRGRYKMDSLGHP